MDIIIGSDHAGFELKEHLVVFLKSKGYMCDDTGCFSPDPVDYPDIAFSVAEKLAKNSSLGILVCGTGIGMSIAANKVNGIRAALCHNAGVAELSKKHNNSNILVLGGRIINKDDAEKITLAWLNAAFEGGRHKKRLDKIEEFEKCR